MRKLIWLAVLAAILVGYTKMKQDVFSETTLIELAAAPSVGTGTGKVYLLSDGFLYFRNDAGEITKLTGEGGSPGGTAFASLDMQFSPAEMHDSIVVPWRRITDYADLVGDGNKLTLMLAVGAVSPGTATLLVTPEYWVDQTVVVEETLYITPLSYQGIYGVTWTNSLEISSEGDTSLVLIRTETHFDEKCILLQTDDEEPMSGYYLLSALQLHYEIPPNIPLTIRLGKSSATPVLPTNSTEYVAVARTSEAVFLTPESSLTNGANAFSIGELLDEVTTAIGDVNGILVFITPDVDSGTGLCEFAAPVAVGGLLGGGGLSEPAPGPQGIIYEGFTQSLDLDDIDPKEIGIDLPDIEGSADVRQVIFLQLDWTPEAGLFQFATETKVRVNVRQKDGEGTLEDDVAVFISGISFLPEFIDEGS